jgi:TatD DNase family protein
MFDTHCHLNFKAFKKILPEVIQRAKDAGITNIVIPGTDLPTSQKAVQIAQEHEHVYAAVGVHPHHVFQYLTIEKNSNSSQHELVMFDLAEIEKLAQDQKVVAIGEVGMDKHVYENTKYESYVLNNDFLDLQKVILLHYIKLAISLNKSLILHNREAKPEMLEILRANWSSKLENRAVFHCCEPDEELLAFAQEHKMFIGVDGDITYYPEKQEFIEKVPLEMLVLETDAPFLLPEPLKSEKKYPNEPSYIPVFVKLIAELKNISQEELIKQTTQNARRLFNL